MIILSMFLRARLKLTIAKSPPQEMKQNEKQNDVTREDN